MALPGLNEGLMTADPVNETFSETSTSETLDQRADTALTARAIVAVTFAGAGFWYLLWKLALVFVAGR
jgi:hypothetical protein